MSDTANPANLASIDDFDARLKRTDEDRWLATRYAAQPQRELLVALYLFNQELQRALHTKEAILGKIRLQWWRETLEQLGGAGALRRHDLAEELARVIRERKDLLVPMGSLVDAYDDVIDDHLQAGGHQAGGDHEARHMAVEGRMMRLAGQALLAEASEPDLAALAAAGEARVAAAAELEGAEARWSAARAGLRGLPPAMWPAVLHLAGSRDTSPLAKRWRMFVSTLLQKL